MAAAVITLNSAGRCSHCGGIVVNIDGRRRTREQLAETHEATCPGVRRGGKAIEEGE